MLSIPLHDDDLRTLEGATVRSSTDPDVSYRVDTALGSGAMSVAFLALRRAPKGVGPVVLKIIRPWIMMESARTGALVIQKEAEALSRLNDCVPPTPFVVRLIETGQLQVSQGGTDFSLPWISIEYVHGATEGATLAARIGHSVEHAGHAFDPQRACRVVHALARGIDAIHEAGVLHRDLNPRNVLCCGFGEEEIFKIADFGAARPQGMPGTFAGIPIGTPGYAAPEQTICKEDLIGPPADIFSLATVIYETLTGEKYFPARSPVENVVLAQKAHRRQLTEAAALAPELRSQTDACAVIDQALAAATAPEPKDRPRTGRAVAELLLPALQAAPRRLRSPTRPVRSVPHDDIPTLLSGWAWSVRHQPGDGRIVRSVAWEADGTCMTATASGLEHWNGTHFASAPLDDAGAPEGLRFVHRVSPGHWLVGGDAATLVQFSREGTQRVKRGADPSVSFTLAAGDTDKVLVATRPGGPPHLYANVAGRWFAPVPVDGATVVTGAARFDDERWLVVGRDASKAGFAAFFMPRGGGLERLDMPPTRSYLGCAAQIDNRLAVLVGVGGQSVRLQGDDVLTAAADGRPDLSAVAVDIDGVAWAASAGRLWLQQPQHPRRWTCAWNSEGWQAPFVSVFACLGLVVAITVEGGIVEGRSVGPIHSLRS